MTLGKLLEDIAERFALPAQVTAGLPLVTVTGDKSVLVENHRGILEYSDEIIIFAGGRVKIAVCGSGLSLKAMNTRLALIGGRIASVSLE